MSEQKRINTEGEVPPSKKVKQEEPGGSDSSENPTPQPPLVLNLADLMNQVRQGRYLTFRDKCLLITLSDYSKWNYGTSEEERNSLDLFGPLDQQKIDQLRENGITIRVAMTKNNDPSNRVVNIINDRVLLHSSTKFKQCTLNNLSANIMTIASDKKKIGITVNAGSPQAILVGHLKIQHSYPSTNCSCGHNH